MSSEGKSGKKLSLQGIRSEGAAATAADLVTPRWGGTGLAWPPLRPMGSGCAFRPRAEGSPAIQAPSRVDGSELGPPLPLPVLAFWLASLWPAQGQR